MIKRAQACSLVVSAALLLAAMAVPSSARPQPTDPDRPRSGAAAVKALGAELPAVARRHGISAAELERILTTDRTARIGRSQRLFYVDALETDATTRPTAAAAYPLAQTFALHSRPGASKVLYLDFDGHDVSGTWWQEDFPGLESRHYGGFDVDGVAGFSDAEHALIQETWQRIAEDYAPLLVDVTTEDPGAAALTRTASNPQVFGSRALFTMDQHVPEVICGRLCAGVAYVGTFDWPDSGGSEPAWIFADPSYDAQTLAAIASHELGHNLGLSHDGTSENEYFRGQGHWAPIMGAGIAPVSQFSRGDYANASNQQDDFAVMRYHGLYPRPDDHASSRTDSVPATSLKSSSPVPGVIETRADVDWFRYGQGCTGPASVTVRPAEAGANLDVRLAVYDGAGTQIAVSDPAAGVVDGSFTGLGASWATSSRPGGTYYVSVEGVGHGDPMVTGYSDYGSVGQYTVAVSAACQISDPAVPSAPTRALARALSPTYAELRWAPPVSDGGRPITGYVVSRNGQVVHTLTPDSRADHFPDLARGATYTFTVAARTEAGLGQAVKLTVRMPDPPNAPVVRLVGTSYTSATISWSTPTDMGASSLKTYQVRRHDGGWFGIGTGTRYTFTNLRPGELYGLWVRAVTADGPGVEAGLNGQTKALTRPGAPRIAQAYSGVAGGTANALARWVAPVSDGGAPIGAYRIRALKLNSKGAVVWQRVYTVDGSLRRKWLVLPAGRYRFRVAAVNRLGTAAQSAASNIAVAR